MKIKEKKMRIIVLCLLLILTGSQINARRLASLPEVERPGMENHFAWHPILSTGVAPPAYSRSD
jgi:hypothetical protein